MPHCGNGNESFIIGALSLVIWTITLPTTVKYVLIAMKADNPGESFAKRIERKTE